MSGEEEVFPLHTFVLEAVFSCRVAYNDSGCAALMTDVTGLRSRCAVPCVQWIAVPLRWCYLTDSFLPFMMYMPFLV
ncbi:MAG: hypothetical protein Q4D28_00005 [Prevotellaceae bacterium]|nr:hypothetical protein [Prevotellaceae bacterium]